MGEDRQIENFIEKVDILKLDTLYGTAQKKRENSTSVEKDLGPIWGKTKG